MLMKAICFDTMTHFTHFDAALRRAMEARLIRRAEMPLGTQAKSGRVNLSITSRWSSTHQTPHLIDGPYRFITTSGYLEFVMPPGQGPQSLPGRRSDSDYTALIER
jgi:hypothetical protein